MTPEELIADPTLRAREFPVTTQGIFLAHAGVCPLPARASRAIQDYATQSTLFHQEQALPSQLVQRTRQAAASLIGATPGEIALIGPTSNALSMVATGLRFRRGENILIYFDDYPSNVYPWMALADRGVEVRFLNTRQLGRIRTIDVLGQVDENTRLVALASCHYLSGFRIDVDAIGRGLHDRGILFCLDAIQTLGAFPTDVASVDFLAADSHKWMLGPCGAGILYVKKEVQDRLRPVFHGWHNVKCPSFISQEELEFKEDARRYEAGTHLFLGLAGMLASMEMLLATGIDTIGRNLAQKRAWLVPRLLEKGYTVLHADAPPQNQGGITTFHKPGEDMTPLYNKLEAAGIITSLRADRLGTQYLRLSPHFYNTPEELGRVLEHL